MKARKSSIYFWGMIFTLSFFILGLVTLSHYGINWDETRHYYKGQAILHFFLTGKKDYQDLELENKRSIYQSKDYPFSRFLSQDPFCCHPPLNDTLASFSNYIFYQKLGILPDIEAHHLFILFVSSLLVGVIFLFVAWEYGFFPGLIASLSLFLYPFFLGESHFNIKDPVETSFYSLALIIFYWGIVKNNWRFILLSAVFTGFALGTKFNIFFAAFIFLPWLIIYHWGKIKSLQWPFSLKLNLAFILFPLISFGILYVSWPLLWQQPWEGLLKAFQYYKEVGYSQSYQPAQYLFLGRFNVYAVEWIVFTTPIIILVLSLLGIFYAARYGLKEKNKMSLFVLFWFLVPILRVTLVPNAGLFMGIRHIAEFIPAMAIMSGIGASYIVSLFHCFIVKHKKELSIKAIEQSNNRTIKISLQLLVVLSFLPITLKLISIHPNENVFFNSLIGGVKGAKERNIQYWGTSYGNVYRQAANWLNSNAEKNAKITLAVNYEGSMLRTWLRPDLDFSNQYRRDFLQRKGEYVVEMTSDLPAWPPFCYWVYVRNFLEPVYEIKVDEVAILAIWKNDFQHTKPAFLSEKKIQLLDKCVERNEFN